MVATATGLPVEAPTIGQQDLKRRHVGGLEVLKKSMECTEHRGRLEKHLQALCLQQHGAHATDGSTREVKNALVLRYKAAEQGSLVWRMQEVSHRQG
jgi:hypothetical protein